MGRVMEERGDERGVVMNDTPVSGTRNRKYSP
jgi:hypothetical protein